MRQAEPAPCTTARKRRHIDAERERNAEHALVADQTHFPKGRGTADRHDQRDEASDGKIDVKFRRLPGSVQHVFGECEFRPIRSRPVSGRRTLDGQSVEQAIACGSTMRGGDTDDLPRGLRERPVSTRGNFCDDTHFDAPSLPIPTQMRDHPPRDQDASIRRSRLWPRLLASAHKTRGATARRREF